MFFLPGHCDELKTMCKKADPTFTSIEKKLDRDDGFRTLTDIDGKHDLCPSMLLCPKCKRAIMQMDGLMNLVCPTCGYKSGGGST